MEPLLFPDELEGHVQDGFNLTDLLGHYINTGGCRVFSWLVLDLLLARYRFLKGRAAVWGWLPTAWLLR